MCVLFCYWQFFFAILILVLLWSPKNSLFHYFVIPKGNTDDEHSLSWKIIHHLTTAMGFGKRCTPISFVCFCLLYYNSSSLHRFSPIHSYLFSKPNMYQLLHIRRILPGNFHQTTNVTVFILSSNSLNGNCNKRLILWDQHPSTWRNLREDGSCGISWTYGNFANQWFFTKYIPRNVSQKKLCSTMEGFC